MSKRLVWADLVRIFAIYNILVLHVLQLPNASHTNYIFFIGVTLADTCVPLLVMLSGSLLISKQESYATFFRKRVSHVVIPWITWSCIFTAISLYFQGSSNLSSIVYTFHLIFVPFFWFIVLVCALYCITPALRIFVHAAKLRDIFLIVLLWFITVCVLPYVRDTQAFPLHVDNGIVRLVINFIGYFLIGFLISKMKRQKKYLLLTGVLFIVGLGIRRLYLSTGSDFIDPGLLIVSVSLFSFIYLLEDFYQQRFNPPTKKIISVISNATLGIYFVHYLFLNRAPLPTLLPTTSLVHFSHDIDFFSNGFIFFILSFIIIFLLQKIPYIKQLVT